MYITICIDSCQWHLLLALLAKSKHKSVLMTSFAGNNKYTHNKADMTCKCTLQMLAMVRMTTVRMVDILLTVIDLRYQSQMQLWDCWREAGMMSQ